MASPPEDWEHIISGPSAGKSSDQVMMNAAAGAPTTGAVRANTNSAQPGDTRSAMAPLTPQDDPVHQAKHHDKQLAAGAVHLLPMDTCLHVNIMCWGESGLGKTTFINNFVKGWDIESKGAAFGLHASSKTSLSMFKQDPRSMRMETKPIKDTNSTMHLIIRVQDMPGWGDDINVEANLRAVVEFLLKQRQLDLDNNNAGATEYDAASNGKMTHAITVCLYFLPPHRHKELDLYMMEGISSLVAVVPVIAKADTHTEPELEQYRRDILQVIQYATNKAAGAAAASAALGGSTNSSSSSGLVTPFKTYSFDPSDLAALQAPRSRTSCFAVMGSQDVLRLEDATLGVLELPRRAYPWGTALPVDREHSDVIVMKHLLTGNRNKALYRLLDDSWGRAHAFFKVHKQLKHQHEQLQQQAAQAALAKQAVQAARPYLYAAQATQVTAPITMEPFKLDLTPLVDQIMTRSSSFGTCSSEKPRLQDRLRCEEQHKLEQGLQQALAEAERLKKECETEKQLRQKAQTRVKNLEPWEYFGMMVLGLLGLAFYSWLFWCFICWARKA